MSSAQPYGTPPYAADCSGRHGDVGAHRLTLRDNTQLRKYNHSTSQRVAVLAKNKRLHLFYETSDEYGNTMWASRAYVGHYVCGYVYSDWINWHSSW